MTNEKDTQQRQYIAIDPYLLSRGHEDDEINLIDLWKTLMKRWKIIAITTIAISSIALAYALLAPKEYKTEVIFSPPTLGDIQVFSQYGSDVINTESVYSTFQQELRSRYLLRQFFDQQELFSVLTGDNSSLSPEQVFVSFIEDKVGASKPTKKNNNVAFSLTWDDAKEASRLTNEYARLAMQTTANRLAQDLRKTLKTRAHILTIKIASALQDAEQSRKDRIEVLTEAKKIAETLNIKDSPDFLSALEEPASVQASENPAARLSANSAKPLYYRGSNALHEEVQAIQSRSSALLAPKLRQFEQELHLLQKFLTNLSPDRLQVAHIDQAAYPPEKPEKPKKKLIVIIGVILGGMLGVFLAFFLHFIESVRQEDKKQKQA